MRKFQCLFFVLKWSYVYYYIICMTIKCCNILYIEKMNIVKATTYNLVIAAVIFWNSQKCKGILRISWSYFRSSRLRPAILLKERLWHRCFPVNFAKFLGTFSLTEHLRWLVLLFFQKLFTKPYFVDPQCDCKTSE